MLLLKMTFQVSISFSRENMFLLMLQIVTLMRITWTLPRLGTAPVFSFLFFPIQRKLSGNVKEAVCVSGDAAMSLVRDQY